MAKQKLRYCDVAFAAFEFVKKHKLDTADPSHLASISKTFQTPPSMILRLLRIQTRLPVSVTADWRKSAYTVDLSAMQWLTNQNFKTSAEYAAAFAALQYRAEVGE